MADLTEAELEAQRQAEADAQAQRDAEAEAQAQANANAETPDEVSADEATLSGIDTSGGPAEDLRQSQASTSEGSVVDGVEDKHIQTAYSD